ncbi:MAG TPA: alpha/beta hydrolase [Chthoniobacterales bacterium]|nr:alpha/beta hydrolase [Chthoniobacterales bacterium]
MKAWIGATILLAVLILVVLLILLQRRFFYFPRKYSADEIEAAEKQGAMVLGYDTSQGRQTAFLYGTPPSGTLLSRLWIVFGGNAMTALDWVEILRECQLEAGGFLLVDYPGYGLCAGNPGADSILENAIGAYQALIENKRWIIRRPHLGVLGWSIGAAAGLQFAEKFPVQDLVLIAPFTTMEDMVKRFTGIRPGMLLLDRFDNVQALSRVCAQTPPPAVTIVHGEKDALIPVSMGRSLAQSRPDPIEFHSIAGGSHNTVFWDAKELIYAKLQGEPAPSS